MRAEPKALKLESIVLKSTAEEKTDAVNLIEQLILRPWHNALEFGWKKSRLFLCSKSCWNTGAKRSNFTLSMASIGNS